MCDSSSDDDDDGCAPLLRGCCCYCFPRIKRRKDSGRSSKRPNQCSPASSLPKATAAAGRMCRRPGAATVQRGSEWPALCCTSGLYAWCGQRQRQRRGCAQFVFVVEGLQELVAVLFGEKVGRIKGFEAAVPATAAIVHCAATAAHDVTTIRPDSGHGKQLVNRDCSGSVIKEISFCERCR